MSMKPLTSIAAAAALGLSLFAGAALADAHSMAIDDDLAAKVQQEIALIAPVNGDSTATIDVQAEDGRLVLSGLVDSNQTMDAINQMLQDMDGLDMDMVDNNLVMQ